ncbi:CPBP family intramembrane glutamic endopeptidase [Gudongella sp. DL1XJH-153]|uniref:CPBP family intramembrane glutamic endopeptidase n=1 Tax=Gudongella sp. DL1XJH-153 TaxID=3409804 RepID=UPI003BB70819
MEKARNFIIVILLSFLLLFIPRTADYFANLFDYSTIDPDGSFAWISVHHIFQALIFLLIMIFLKKRYNLNFGLHWGDKTVGKIITLRFFKYFTFYTIGSFTFLILTNGFQHFQFPLTATNIVGYMGFQLLLSGPSEELIFRAFAITMFSLFLKRKTITYNISSANLLAAVVFAMAHMSFTFNPFGMTYSSSQLVLAFGLGIFYGICYEKSGSMYYPMIMHSFSNVLMVGATIVLSFIL